MNFNHLQKDCYESMYDAITDCESHLTTSKDKYYFPPSWENKKHTRSLYLDDIFINEDLRNDNLILQLQNLGVDDETIQYLVEKRRMSLIQTAHEILTEDIEPNADELGNLSNEDYPYVDMLSRREISELYHERAIRGKRGMKENKRKIYMRKMNSNFDEMTNK